jgi:hypothetical protein
VIHLVEGVYLKRVGMLLDINKYMMKNFPGLSLEPPLFYNWNVGIRFELGDPNEEDEKKYMERVLKRSKTLLQTLHKKDDEIFIVCYFDQLNRKSFKKLNVFTPFLTRKNIKYQIKHQIFPFRDPEEDEDGEWETHRLLLKCVVADINLPRIIQAFFYNDMPRLYFINIKRETIFSIYDDRGCDLVATKKEALKEIYHVFNDWILDYDRSRINKLFKC